MLVMAFFSSWLLGFLASWLSGGTQSAPETLSRLLGLLESFHRLNPSLTLTPLVALCTHLALLGKHNPLHFSPRGMLTPL